MSFSEQKKKELLQKVFWDKTADTDYALELLKSGAEHFQGDRADLYRRLLMTYDWYTLLDLIPREQLEQEVFTETVITRLFPKELRDKYRYARHVLSG